MRKSAKLLFSLWSVILFLACIQIDQVIAQTPTLPGARCEGAPFIWPTWGRHDMVYLEPYGGGRTIYEGDDGKHDGIDIGQVNRQENVEPVYAVCDGLLYYSTDIWLTIKCDPIDSRYNVPERNIYVYYTHMGNYSKTVSYILPEFRKKSATQNIRLTQGQLIGKQGNAGCTYPSSVHLHISVNTTGNERSRIDPSPYFGDSLNYESGARRTNSTPPFNCTFTQTPIAADSEDYPTLQAFDEEGKFYWAARQTTDNEIATRATIHFHLFGGYIWSFWEKNGKTPGSIQMSVFKGNLYQAVRGMDNNLVYTRFKTVGGSWSSWEENSRTTLSSVQMEVFDSKLYQAVRGTDNQIYTRFTADGVNWSAWKDNSNSALTLSAVKMKTFDSKLWQAVRGTDNGIYIRSMTTEGIWSGWTRTDTTTLTEKTLSDIQMEVFHDRLYQVVRGEGNGIYTRYTADGINWIPWQKNGETLNAIQMKTFQGRLYQAVRGDVATVTENRIYTRFTTDGDTWTPWTVDGSGRKTLSAVGMEEFNGKLYQTIRGTDNKIYIRSYPQNNDWSAWSEGFGLIATVTPADGGFASFDGVASVMFPAGATSQDLDLSIAAIESAEVPAANGGFTRIGNAYDFSALNVAEELVRNFNTNIDVTLKYDPNQIGAIDEYALKMSYYDEATTQWVELPSTIDTVQHTVTALTNHFTKFAIFGPVASVPPEPPVDPNPPVNPPSTVPEPATLFLFGAGLLGLLCFIRKKVRK